MDELELLKKDWQNKAEDFKTYTEHDIYKMSHNKSSSIVKRLFYISIVELVFWVLVNVLPFLFSGKMEARIGELSHSWVYIFLNALSYTVICLFIYLLWKSYKAISVTDNIKKLMESILKTRKIIKYYVLYNLLMAFISVPIGLYFSIKEHPEISIQLNEASTMQLLVIFLVCLIFTAIIIGLFWLIYRIIYGILIKRLKNNYNELKKLEV